jgi:hypothetical protein
MVLDVGLDAGDLPWRQAALQQRRRRVRGADIIAEKGRCASDAGPRSVAIALDHLIGVLEKFDHGHGEPSALTRILLSGTGMGAECQYSLLLRYGRRISGG